MKALFQPAIFTQPRLPVISAMIWSKVGSLFRCSPDPAFYPIKVSRHGIQELPDPPATAGAGAQSALTVRLLPEPRVWDALLAWLGKRAKGTLRHVDGSYIKRKRHPVRLREWLDWGDHRIGKKCTLRGCETAAQHVFTNLRVISR